MKNSALFWALILWMRSASLCQAEWIVEGVQQSTAPPSCRSLCVSPVGFQIDPGTNLSLHACIESRPGSAQQWGYNHQSRTISNVVNSVCMQADRQRVYLATCKNNASQRWQREEDGKIRSWGSFYLHAPPHNSLLSTAADDSSLQLFLGGRTNALRFTWVEPLLANEYVPPLPRSNSSNIIQNGGFDDISLLHDDSSINSQLYVYRICSWTLSAGPVGVLPIQQRGAIEGNFSLQLTAYTSIRQRVPVYNGSAYILFLQLSGNASCRSSVSQITVDVDPSSLSSKLFTWNASEDTVPKIEYAYFVVYDASVWVKITGNSGTSSCAAVIDSVQMYVSDDSLAAQLLKSSNRGRKRFSWVISLYGCIALAGLLITCLIALAFWRRAHRPTAGRSQAYREGDDLRRYSFTEILSVTNNFSDLIGEGAFGRVYRGTRNDGSVVAVKRLIRRSPEEGSSFEREMKTLSRVHHRCVVNFLGFCCDRGEHGMVLEYMPNGSLKDHLHEGTGGRSLSWESRMRIGFQIAYGLEYLHHGANPPVIHRDMKSANVLLDEQLSAKISDFGLSRAGRALQDDRVASTWTAPQGTPGYMDPQYCQTYVLSEKSDVFSYGVILLELITGRRAVQDEENLVKWAEPFLNGEEHPAHMLAESLKEAYDPAELESISDICRSCLMANGKDRPAMLEVVMIMKEKLNRCLQAEINAPTASTMTSARTGAATSAGSLITTLSGR